MATATNKTVSHVVLFPCSGIGHLIPFLRLAAMVASRGCTVTLVTLHPTVSNAESDQLSTFFALHPHVKRLDFQPISFKKSKFINEDPFFMQVEAISNSVHLLGPLLSSVSPPLSAIIADFSIANSISRFAADLSISTYVLVTTSARFFSLMLCLPKLLPPNSDKNSGDIETNDSIELPSLGLVPISSIPPPMLNSDHFFSSIIRTNTSCLCDVNGILMNTFNGFEEETIEALSSGNVIPDLAPILALGPFESYEVERAPNLPWLDEQPQESVVFINFGSRTALVFLPSGIANMAPFFQLSVKMASHNCKITYINMQEPQAMDPNFSYFIATHPEIDLIDFETHPLTTSDSTINDPFIARLRNIDRSLHRLLPTLSCLPV